MGLSMAVEEIKNFSLTFMSLPGLIKKIQSLLSANVGSRFFVNITVKQKKRSLPANSIYYVWLPDISDKMALTKPEARRYIKLEFGIPILFSTPVDEMTAKVYALFYSLGKSGFFTWPYDEQLVEMDSREVTSLMNTKQHSQMREQMQHFYGVQGLVLDYQK